MSCVELLSEQRVAGLSESDAGHHLELLPVPGSARAAREFVARHAAVSEQALDVLLLLTSEVVTNAVLHARTQLVLGVTCGDGVVLVTVTDGSQGRPVQPPADNARPSGRGLLLVEELSQEWGVRYGEKGKTVWFAVADTEPSGGRDESQ